MKQAKFTIRLLLITLLAFGSVLSSLMPYRVHDANAAPPTLSAFTLANRTGTVIGGNTVSIDLSGVSDADLASTGTIAVSQTATLIITSPTSTGPTVFATGTNPLTTADIFGSTLLASELFSQAAASGGIIPVVGTLSDISGTTSIAINVAVNFTIISSAGANGTIAPLGTTTVPAGASSTFTITPNTGYLIADVVVDGTSTGTSSTRTFSNVLANHTISAAFAPIPVFHNIISSAGANGTIAPLGTTSVLSGASSTFTMTPDPGFAVADVLVDGVSVGAVASYTFINVVATHTIAVSFHPSPVLTTITVSPANPTIATSTTRQFSALTLDQYGAPFAAAVTWSSSNTAVGTINASSGLFSALTVGTTTITATSGTTTGSTLATVVTTPTLTNITVLPATSTVMDGLTQQFSASTTDQFGAPISASTTWSSSNPAVGTINAATGLFTAVASGTAVISASNSGIIGTATVTVTPDTVAPNAPANLTASAVSAAQINLIWSPATDNGAIAGYQIFRNGTTTMIATTSNTSYSDTGLAANTVYSYAVRAIDAGGNLSPFSAFTSATTQSVPSGGGGGGGAIITTITAISNPLIAEQNRDGRLDLIFSPTLKALLVVPQGAIAERTFFRIDLNTPNGNLQPDRTSNAYLAGNTAFNIRAENGNGTNIANFSKELTITLTVPLPADWRNVSAYYRDDSNQRWVKIPNSIIIQELNQVTFRTTHLTDFAVLYAPGLPDTIKTQKKADDDRQVAGVKIYPDGTLLRDSNNRIYVIINGVRKHILNFQQLLKYVGKSIINVNQDVLNQYPLAANIDDGKLIRGSGDVKIYFIVNQSKRHVRTLFELRQKHAGKPIISVNSTTLAAY